MGTIEYDEHSKHTTPSKNLDAMRGVVRESPFAARHFSYHACISIYIYIHVYIYIYVIVYVCIYIYTYSTPATNHSSFKQLSV